MEGFEKRTRIIKIDTNMPFTELEKSTITEISKSQTIRLVDVFLIGSILIYAGTQKKLAPELNALLIGIGVATIFYNGKNYLDNEEMVRTPGTTNLPHKPTK